MTSTLISAAIFFGSLALLYALAMLVWWIVRGTAQAWRGLRDYERYRESHPYDWRRNGL